MNYDEQIRVSANDALLAELLRMNKRLVRVESKQARLMLHFGIQPRFDYPKKDADVNATCAVQDM